ncbi:hypothetical protein BDZ97DRAFT_1730296 [Flammula alnicola]|nr:hypothetical protein BDZ97DRAFT_1741631 [Flammula alnicola]KAF8965320.1 hypothetical protein BDZ97DRAFT_1730296 [Flammula alnicola]
MRFSIAAAATLLSVVSVQAVDHLVKVGANSSLIFDPTNITAVAGDTISFQFQGKNHSVTQSTFASPCVKMTTPTAGVDSGFMPVASGATQLPQWTITVSNATAPLWFFCAQTAPVSHCGSGMVFAVNAPPAKTFAQFQAAAKATAGNSTAATPSASASGSSGSGAAASGVSASTPAASSTTAKSGALRLGGSAAGVLTVAALFVGLL